MRAPIYLSLDQPAPGPACAAKRQPRPLLSQSQRQRQHRRARPEHWRRRYHGSDPGPNRFHNLSIVTAKVKRSNSPVASSESTIRLPTSAAASIKIFASPVESGFGSRAGERGSDGQNAGATRTADGAGSFSGRHGEQRRGGHRAGRVGSRARKLHSRGNEPCRRQVCPCARHGRYGEKHSSIFGESTVVQRR